MKIQSVFRIKLAQIMFVSFVLSFFLACNPSQILAKSKTKSKKSKSKQKTAQAAPAIKRQQLNYGEKSDEAFEFEEVWGYVMVGRENEFNPKSPITDVGYFVSAVNTYSEMDAVPERDKFFKDYTGRVHLVTSVDSRSQAHLLLDPELPLRERIIEQMIEAAKTYDGLQIDWENIPKNDYKNFLDFLKILRKEMPNKPLTIAVPARLKTLENDIFDYKNISEVVDKILIMAYDEHWSTSAPGAIGSTDWCRRIAEYAKTVIPENKLVMGISLYGRTWLSVPYRGQAWYESGIERIKKENGIKEVKRDSYGVPHFTFKETGTITGWYDDITSLKVKFKMYKDIGVNRIGFWRLGFEEPDLWKEIKLPEPDVEPTKDPEVEFAAK
ncbi:MAG: glycoside hydrolase [Treponema sp.]|nr:glycoside hydrolase [Treponema sp.]